MAVTSSGIQIFINGYDVACALTSFSPDKTTEMLDATTLCKTSKVYKPGYKDGTFAATGVWDADTTDNDEIDDILKSAYSNQSQLQITRTLQAPAVGEYAEVAENALLENYTSGAESGQLIMADANFKADNGLEAAVILFTGSAEAGSPVNSTAVDNTSSTSSGGFFIGHVYEESDSAATNGLFTLQHSTDNSTWVDLVAQTGTGAANGVVTATVADGTTINRYLRVNFATATGKGYGLASFVRR